MHETKKVLNNTKDKTTKDENRENMPNSKIVKEVLLHYNAVNNNYQEDSIFLCTFFSK